VVGNRATVRVLDPSTGVLGVAASVPTLTDVPLSRDGTVAAFGDDKADWVIDVATGKERRVGGENAAAKDRSGLQAVSPDGSLLLDSDMRVWDAATGDLITQYTGRKADTWDAEFDPTGTSVYSTGRDGSLHRWDSGTGETLAVVPAVGIGKVAPLADGLVLVSNPELETASLIDTKVRGEPSAIPTCKGFVNGSTLAVADGLAIFGEACGDDVAPRTFAIDLARQRIAYQLPGEAGQTLAVSPDGRRFVRQEAQGTRSGPLAIHDLATGAKTIGLEGLCWWDDAIDVPPPQQVGCHVAPATPFPFWAKRIRWSPDGSMIAAGDIDNVAVWDASSGSLLHVEPRWPGPPPPNPLLFDDDLVFTDDSSRLLISFGSDSLVSLDVHRWQATRKLADPTVEGFRSLGFAGSTPDGSQLVVGGWLGTGASALHWMDPTTLEIDRSRSRSRIDDGSVKAMAFSPDRQQLATSASDGFVRVWDARTGAPVTEIPMGDVEIQGVAYTDATHLAVIPKEGTLYILTTSPEELLRFARRSVSRGFDKAECERYRLDPCPTLEDLRAGRS
jgi:WD40 repeat protein